jgi:capsular polysaccharide transport system permease protein
MSSSNQNEEDRITAWRAERQRVAEEEKAARLATRDASRAEAARAEAKEQDAAVAALLSDLPNESEVGTFLRNRARRLRRRDMLLLIVLVLAPLVSVTAYVNVVATRLHESVSVISISRLSEDGPGAAQGVLGALASPRGLSDVFAADAFLSSGSLSDLLEREMGLASQLRSTALDPFQRLRGGDLSQFIDSAVDVQTGLLTLRVRLPDPAQAIEANQRILDLVALHVNQVHEVSRSERMRFAEAALVNAQTEMRDAREALSALQVNTGEIDPRMRLEAVQEDIRRVEARIRELRFENDQDRADGDGRRFDIERREGMIRSLEGELAALRENLTLTEWGGPALGDTLMQHDMARLRIEIAHAALVAAFETRRDAQRAVELERSVVQVIASPFVSPGPVRPRPALALLITLLIGLSGYFLVRSLFPEELGLKSLMSQSKDKRSIITWWRKLGDNVKGNH